MINFYPGPSKIHEQYATIAYDLLKSGLASYNHRSKEFSQGYDFSVSILKQKLELPEGYEIVFLSSATECWETICQSFTDKKSLFFYNGNFGEKWTKQGSVLMNETENGRFHSNENISDFISKNNLSDNESYELVCYVHNETANTTKINSSDQKNIRSTYPNALIAVDATSSLGADKLSYNEMDICFASVQKCMGMPAGLAIMVLSPKAIKQLENREKSTYYNDLTNILENHKKSQTTHTPNTLNILGIGKLYKTLPTLSSTYDRITDKKGQLEKLIEASTEFDFLIKEKELRSDTVIGLTHNNPSQIISNALDHGIILGKGYGSWKNNSVRIANFPAHSDEDFEILFNFIKQCK